MTAINFFNNALLIFQVLLVSLFVRQIGKLVYLFIKELLLKDKKTLQVSK